MGNNVTEKINYWLSFTPESSHNYDTKRLLEVIKFAYMNGSLSSLNNIDLEKLVRTKQPTWKDDKVWDFVKEKKLLFSFVVQLLDSMQDDNTIQDYRLH